MPNHNDPIGLSIRSKSEAPAVALAALSLAMWGCPPTTPSDRPDAVSPDVATNDSSMLDTRSSEAGSMDAQPSDDAMNDSAVADSGAGGATHRDVLSGTCAIGDASYSTGEMYFEGCTFCVCGPAGSPPICWTRVCTTDSGRVETEFRSVDAGACDPQARTLHQPNEAEVRYPCGIPGGTPRENDPRCASLCAPGFTRTYDRMWCNRGNEPNIVVCWGL